MSSTQTTVASAAALVRPSSLSARVAGWLESRPEVAAGIAAVLLWLLLPFVAGLKYHLLAQKGPYQLMWLNLFGAHYRLPIETPKPLHVLLAGLLGSGAAFYAVTCVMVGLCVAAVMRMSRAVTGTVWPGLVAAATVFVLRGGCIYLVLIGGTEPYHMALVLLSLAALTDRRFRLAALAVFFACLQRPEAWALAPLPLLVAWWSRRRFNPLVLLPFAAPLIWFAFDRLMTGDWLYSLHLTAYYRVASALSAAPPASFWGDILIELSKVAGDVPFVLGFAGIGIWLWKYVRARGTADTTNLRGRPAGFPMVLIGLGAFSPKEVAHSLRLARIDEVRAAAYDPIAAAFKRAIENGSADVAVVSERRLDYFAKLVGPANSWKLLSIREVKNVSGTIPAETESGVVAYYDQDEIDIPPTDSVMKWVIQAWPTEANIDTIRMLPNGRGGLWSIHPVP